MCTYSLTIPGEPVAKARPRMTRGGHVYTPQRTRDYEDFVRQCFQIEHGSPMLEGALALELDLYFGIPKSRSKATRERMQKGLVLHTKKPDADNVYKSITDSLCGIAYKDDSQIAVVHIRKAYSDVPRAEVHIKEIIPEGHL